MYKRQTIKCVLKEAKRKVMQIAAGAKKDASMEVRTKAVGAIALFRLLPEGCSELILPKAAPMAATAGRARRPISSVHPFIPETCAAIKNTNRAAASIIGPPSMPFMWAASVLPFLSIIFIHPVQPRLSSIAATLPLHLSGTVALSIYDM